MSEKLDRVSTSLRNYYNKRYIKSSDHIYAKHKKKTKDTKAVCSEENKSAIIDNEQKQHKRNFLKNIIISIIFFIIGSFFVQENPSKIFVKMGSEFFSFISSFSNDAWLDFLGNIIGSIVAILGVYITINYERRKSEKDAKDKIKPILIIDEKQNEEANEKNSFNICLSEHKNEGEKILTINYPELVIRNLGYSAMNFRLFLLLNGIMYFPDKSINHIPSNEYVVLKLTLNIPKEQWDKLFKGEKKENKIVVMYSDVKNTLYNEIYDGSLCYEKDKDNPCMIKMKILT